LLIEKKDSYARYVREMHQPAISKKKEEELRFLKEAIRHPVRKTTKFSPGQSLDLKRTGEG